MSTTGYEFYDQSCRERDARNAALTFDELHDLGDIESNPAKTLESEAHSSGSYNRYMEGVRSAEQVRLANQ